MQSKENEVYLYLASCVITWHYKHKYLEYVCNANVSTYSCQQDAIGYAKLDSVWRFIKTTVHILRIMNASFVYIRMYRCTYVMMCVFMLWKCVISISILKYHEKLLENGHHGKLESGSQPMLRFVLDTFLQRALCTNYVSAFIYLQVGYSQVTLTLLIRQVGDR